MEHFRQLMTNMRSVFILAALVFRIAVFAHVQRVFEKVGSARGSGSGIEEDPTQFTSSDGQSKGVPVPRRSRHRPEPKANAERTRSY